MLTRSLGSPGISVSQIGLGTWPLAGNAGLVGYGDCDPEQAEATVRAAIDAGITLFETADIYGDGFAETLLGRLCPSESSECIICTKGGFQQFSRGLGVQADEWMQRVDASRDRLRRDRVDVYLLHNPPARWIGLSELYRPLVRLRERGRIGRIGVAVAHPLEAWLALDRPEVDVIQLAFNVVQSDADEGFLRRAVQKGKTILAREVLVNGLISGKYGPASQFKKNDFRATIPPDVASHLFQSMERLEPYRRRGETWVEFALRFVLDRPEISSAIVGARSPEQVRALANAGSCCSSPFDSETAPIQKHFSML